MKELFVDHTGRVWQRQLCQQPQNGGSPPAQQSQTSNTVTYSPEETAARNDIMAKGKDLYSNFVNSKPAYPGEKVAGASPETTQAQNMLIDFSTGRGQQVADQGFQALNYGLNTARDPNNNPALQASIQQAQRKVGETFTDPGGVISNIRSNFMSGAPGGQSSREAIAMGVAGRGYANAIGDIQTGMTNNAYNVGQKTFSDTMAFTPQMYNLMTQPALTLDSVGQQRQAQQQAVNAYDAGLANWGLNAPWQNLGNYANLVYGGSNPTTTTMGTGTSGTAAKNPMGSAMSGAMMGASIGGPWGAAAGGAAGLLMGS